MLRYNYCLAYLFQIVASTPFGDQEVILPTFAENTTFKLSNGIGYTSENSCQSVE